ncbi:MAG: nucleotidyltransferase domain-containing protein [Chloroflexi bacterium]|nr:nucleotidyltransferase domain-containing protein [Chloroflexota bacterium]
MDSQTQPAVLAESEVALAAARERKQMLEQELDRFVKILVEQENPELILIFGSLVTGEIHEWSDIDLVVVQETELPFMKRLHHLRGLLQPQVGVDLLCYTPDEFDQMARERIFFKHEILGKGVVVYERGNPTMAGLRAGRLAHSRTRTH